jgi:hypothetical protein
MSVYRHIDTVGAVALFSECGKYRYRLDISLKITCGKDSKTVCAILQNPSVANSEIADKSVQFLEKLIFSKGLEPFRRVDKLIIVNQFAHIETKGFSGKDEHIGDDNDQHIRDAVTESDIVLVAWGSRNPYRERKHLIESYLKACKDKKLLWGKSHPSRGQYAGYVSDFCFVS